MVAKLVFLVFSFAVTLIVFVVPFSLAVALAVSL